MPRVSNIELLQKSEQPTLSIRTRAKVEDLPTLIGEGYGRMADYLKELGEFFQMSRTWHTTTWICRTSMWR